MINRIFSYLGMFFIGILSLLPLAVLYLFADIIYLILYYIVGYRKAVVRENLVNSFPEKSQQELEKIEKKYYRYLASLIFEIIKMASISASELNKRFVYKNKEFVNELLDTGQSILICSAHYGNWEWGTQALPLNLKAVHYPIYKPLNNKIFDRLFLKIRSKFGNRMTTMRHTMRALTSSKNEITAFSFGTDQAPVREESHYWTLFLNQPSAIQLGIEKIAKKTNRPIIYLKVKVLKRGYYEIDCVPLCLEPSKTKEHEITQLHTRFLEGIIKEEPAYWLWSHRRWKHKMPPGQNLT